VDTDRMVKKVYEWKPISRRPQGRQNLRWENDIKNDLKEMKLNNWRFASRIETNGKEQLRRPRLSIYEVVAPDQGELLKNIKDKRIRSSMTANLSNPLTTTSCVKQLKLLLVEGGGDIACRIYGCHFHFSTQYWVVTPFHLQHTHSDSCLIVA
jgi:hypothetical protein